MERYGVLECERVVTWFLVELDEREETSRNPLSIFEDFLFFITDLKINKNDGSPTHYYHSVNSV